MNFSNKIARTISNTMLLALYFGFFFVQLTANFELQNIHCKNSIAQIKCYNYHSTSVNNSTVRVSSTFSNKSNIRLNKRFFPEFAPIINKIQFSIEPIVIIEPIASCYVSPSLETTYLFAFSKRGPPVVA